MVAALKARWAAALLLTLPSLAFIIWVYATCLPWGTPFETEWASIRWLIVIMVAIFMGIAAPLLAITYESVEDERKRQAAWCGRVARFGIAASFLYDICAITLHGVAFTIMVALVLPMVAILLFVAVISGLCIIGYSTLWRNGNVGARFERLARVLERIANVFDPADKLYDMLPKL